MKIQPSEFWSMSLYEFSTLLEHMAIKNRKSNKDPSRSSLTQGDIDRLNSLIEQKKGK